MPRIQPVRKRAADPKQTLLLEAVEKKLGKVPNIIATMANSTAVATAYLGFSQSLAGGSLPARLREQTALVIYSERINRPPFLIKHHETKKSAWIETMKRGSQS